MSSMGKIEAISKEARHNNALIGIPANSFLELPVKSLNVTPGSLLPVINEPPGSFFVDEVFVSDCIDEQAVSTANEKMSKYLSIDVGIPFKLNMQ